MKLTVQGWQNLVLSAMGVVVLSGAVGGALLMNQTDTVSSELIEHLPQRTDSRQQVAEHTVKILGVLEVA